ncbi:hypothetical protein AXA44_29655 [Rhodococcus sp. SC4]|nr:hypothetical protein AXA44_29655 [Rhodococcus sp. SC4]
MSLSAPPQTDTLVFAIIYARVSHDVSGIQRSPDEQVADCRKYCEAHGWIVREVIIDNDMSASAFARGKQRPGYRRVMSEIQPGEALVVWEPSRFTRKMDDHQDLVNLCKDKGILFCAGGEINDFTNPNDELKAGMKAQFSQYEAQMTSMRVRRNTKSRAEAGRPHGNLGFGYKRIVAANNTTVGWEKHHENAAVVERVAERLLNGQSLYRVSADLNADGLLAPGRTLREGKPSEAGPWSPEKVKAMILRPALAGLRQFQGEVIGEGTWPAILTREQHEKLNAILAHPSQRTLSGPKTKHLCSGIARCGKCDRPTYWLPTGGNKKQPKPQYRCPQGCVQRNAEIVDKLVANAVVEMFYDKVWAASALAGDDDKAARAADDAKRLEQEMLVAIDEVDMLGFSRLTALREKKKIEDEFMPKIKAAQAESMQAVNPALRPFIDCNDPYAVWESLDLLAQRDVVRAVIRVTIFPIRGKKLPIEYQNGVLINPLVFPSGVPPRDEDDIDLTR